MASKRWKEIKELTGSEIDSKLREAELNLFQTRMKKETGQLADTASLWRLRKDVARMKTLKAHKAAGAGQKR